MHEEQLDNLVRNTDSVIKLLFAIMNEEEDIDAYRHTRYVAWGSCRGAYVAQQAVCAQHLLQGRHTLLHFIL